MRGILSISTGILISLVGTAPAHAQGIDNTGITTPMPCVQEHGIYSCNSHPTYLIQPKKKAAQPQTTSASHIALTKTVKCSKSATTEICSGVNVPVVNQNQVPRVGTQACVPSAWASVLGTYYNAGLTDKSSYRMQKRSDLNVAIALASLMHTNNSYGTSVNDQTSVSRFFVADLSGSQALTTARLGYGSSAAFTPQRLAANIRAGRQGVMQIGLYGLTKLSLISGRQTVLYSRTGGHDVFPHTFALLNQDYIRNFNVKIMDPMQKVKSYAKIVPYAVLNPKVKTASGMLFGLSSGNSYVFDTRELPASTGTRVIEGLIYATPR
jgi:hypothetical protein